MLIRVRSSIGLLKITVQDPSPTVLCIKRELERSYQLPLSQQLLLLETMESEPLKDDALLSSLGIKRGDIIKLDGRIEKEEIAKSTIDNDGVLLVAGTKRVIIVPSGNYPSQTTETAHINDRDADSKTTIPSAVSSGFGEDTKSSIKAHDTSPKWHEDLNLNEFNFDEDDALQGRDDTEVRAPIAAKKMVLVDDMVEDKDDHIHRMLNQMGLPPIQFNYSSGVQLHF